MQLFGLVNHLLAKKYGKRHFTLDIQTYFVLPLAPNLGLIEWVPSCDTMHALIREYRERAGIPLNQELKLLVDKSYWQSDYDSLTTIQKVEVFQYTLARTSGDDLAKVRKQASQTNQNKKKKKKERRR